MLMFVITLSVLQKKSEEAVWKERYYRELANRGNIILKDLLEAGFLLHVFKIKQEQALLEQSEEKKKEIIAELKMLRMLSRDERAETSRLESLETASNEALKALNGALAYALNDSTAKNWIFAEESSQPYYTALRKLSDVVAQLQASGEADNQTEEQARRLIGQVLVAGAVISISLAIVLAVVFNRSTTSKLKIMVENTRRLSQKKDLIPRISGKDELAELDHVFHDMAESIDEANRYKQELLNIVSHDLRSPLTSVVVSLNLIKEGALGEITPRVDQSLSQSERNLERLIGLINDLLDYEKMEAGKLELTLAPTVVAALFDHAIDSLDVLAREKHIEIECEPTASILTCDGARLTQVLVNLCSNAIKYSPKNSVITLSAIPAQNSLEFRVKDQGRGIPAEFLDKLFSKYAQTALSDSARGYGTGLGLAICKAYVEAHGGTIGVESEEGKGSTFWFRIPTAA